MYLVVLIEDNVVIEQIRLAQDYESAKAAFLDACNTHISNWDEYDAKDIDDVLDQGYEIFGNKSVCFLDMTNTTGWHSISRRLELGT